MSREDYYQRSSARLIIPEDTFEEYYKPPSIASSAKIELEYLPRTQKYSSDTELKIISQLGIVPSGIVYLAEDPVSGDKYNLTILDVSDKTADEITNIFTEIFSVIDSCEEFSQHIACYYDAKLINSKIHIISELIKGIEINNFVPESHSCFWSVILQLTLGLAHIHTVRYGHGNISTKNIILTEDFNIKYTNINFINNLTCKEESKTIEEQVAANDVWSLITILYEMCNPGSKIPYEISDNCVPTITSNFISKYSKDDGRTNKFIMNCFRAKDLTSEILLSTFLKDVLSPPINFYWPSKRRPVLPILTKRREKIDQYTLLKPLGEGSFGITYLVTDEQGKEVALKAIKLASFKEKDGKFLKGAEAELLREMQILEDLSKNLDNDYVTKYYTHFFTWDYFFIVSEYVDGSDLHSYISKVGGAINPDSLWPIILQLLRGLAFIHEAGYAHKDIKLENIMITKKGSIKYIDFGFSCIQKCKVEDCSYECDKIGRRGTPLYVSPEYIIDKVNFEMEKAHDVWSLMLTIFFLVNDLNTNPFKFSFNLVGAELFKELSRLKQSDINSSRYSLDDGRTNSFVDNNLTVDRLMRKNIQDILFDFVKNVLSVPYLC